MPRLAPLEGDIREAALALRVRPDQVRLVTTVAESLADAERFSDVESWPRAIVDHGRVDDGRVVGFVMGGFGDTEPFRCNVWKLLVGADAQGRGYGRFAVEAVADEARVRGYDTLGVFFQPGPGGPQGFYERLGFVITDPSARPNVHARRPL